MISIPRSITAALVLGGATLAPLGFAQEVPVSMSPASAFSYPLGTVPLGSTGGTVSVQATAPRASIATAQQIKFVVDYNDQKRGGSNFRYYVVSTGRSKSLGQVQAMFADGFARAISAPPGTELCKLGDIAYGGEVRLMARGNGETEMIYSPALSTGNPVFSVAETAAFAQILR